LCCFDWQGLGSIGNVHNDSLPRMIACWHHVRNQISGKVMAPESPDVCLECKMRSMSIPGFVPEVALDAGRFTRESCQV
jgi:hypothetical protein